MSSQNSRHSSLTSLSYEISGIYRNYARKHNDSNSTHSLDSSTNEPTAALHLERPIFDQGSGTPQSASSFDFTVHDRHHITNSSLNVLLDTPGDSKDQFLSVTSLSKSTQSLDPSALKIGPAMGTDESLGSNYDEKISDGDWADRGAAVATNATSSGTAVVRRSVDDFEFGKDLGEGSYSTVVAAKDKITGVQYAVKILDKRHIIKEKKVKYVNIEKHALNRLSQTQGVISLFFTFQDKDSLYYVLEYAKNGELLGLIKKYGTLNEECTRYLGAQILDAIKHMHINGVIHRDIKPENILLDEKFHIRITDFGTAKLLERKKNGDTGVEEDYPLDVRAKSFVGTAEYVSPELLENKYCGKPGDLWAFGCILYQMIAGKPPFKATNEYLTFQKITKLQYAFSAGFPLILRDLIKQILVLQPSRRATVDQIQDHYFFQECDFSDPDSIWNSEIPQLSPYKMNASSMMKMPVSQPPKKNGIKKLLKKPQIQNGNSKTIVSDKKKELSAASVAAYVLGKDEEVPERKGRPPKATPQRKSSAPSNATPEYIPGTNILRPQINKMPSYSVTTSTASSKSDRDSIRRNSSKVMEVTPPTAVEAAWQQYLSPSERVINVGSAIVRKLPTEVFERKNKGYIHDTPLGLNNKLQSISNRNNSRSMLSHVVQGNRMKDAHECSSRPSSQNEDDAITYYPDETTIDSESTQEEEEEKTSSVAPSSAKSFFKKLLPTHDKKQDVANATSASGSSDTAETRHSPMDKVRTYTVLVSTFGRTLLFLRDDHKTDYNLVCEIGLNFPFIQFKEVVSNSSSKFGKMIPSTGIFAIVAPKTTFVFETEKYEVSQWTEALAKSKLNQFEIEMEVERKQSLRESPNSSPKLLESPAFSSPSQRQQKRDVSPIVVGKQSQAPQQKYTGTHSSETRDHSMFKNNMRSKETVKLKRKVPPPLPSSPSLGVSGLPHPEQGGSETIHAAQLAVLNSPVKTNSEYRRSSFSREKNGQATPHATPSPTSGGAKITSMNSKFLARSRGRK
ncbi:hypothetical protein OXX79_010622 [Metschnikowia pulcherrima]